jgi:hypothetical protein
MDEDDVVGKIVNALATKYRSNRIREDANDDDDTTKDYFSEARNMLN